MVFIQCFIWSTWNDSEVWANLKAWKSTFSFKVFELGPKEVWTNLETWKSKLSFKRFELGPKHRFLIFFCVFAHQTNTYKKVIKVRDENVISLQIAILIIATLILRYTNWFYQIIDRCATFYQLLYLKWIFWRHPK